MRILSGRTLIGALTLALVGIAPVTANPGQPADSKTVQAATASFVATAAPTDARPGRVRNTRVQQTNKKLIVRWAGPPRSNVLAVQRYRIRFNRFKHPKVATIVRYKWGSKRRVVVDKPGPGRYQVRVKAINDAGAGRPSKPAFVQVKRR